MMQTLSETSKHHLSHDAALILLAMLPDHIQNAYVNHAQQTGSAIELVLEMALVDFLDPEPLTFTDCKPQIGLSLESESFSVKYWLTIDVLKTAISSIYTIAY